MHIEPLVYALFGLVIGSFLNVCIYRIPRGKSIVFPGSACPRCGSPIRAWDNIPLLSFLLLRGKCRVCGNPISVQYPLVEFLTALAFYSCWKVWDLSPPTFINSLFLSAVIVLVFTDYHHQILPNKLTLPGAAAGLILSPFQSPEFFSDRLSINAVSALGFENSRFVLSPAGSALGALIGGGSLFLLALIYERLRKKQGLGMGDVKMMAMVGAFLGLKLAVLTILIGSLIGTLVGIFLILFRNRSLQTKLPLGVFLGIGSALSLFYGLSFWNWYLRIPR